MKRLIVPRGAFIRRNRLVRELLRHLLTALPRHRQGTGRDILLLSSRRSGSTWLMESLGAEPGLRTVDEPFGPKFVQRLYLEKRLELAEICRGHRLFAFPSDFRVAVDEYMAEPRHTRLCGPYNPLTPFYHWRSERRLWKVIHANPAIDYFLERAHNFHTLALLRHPCPTILSMSRMYRPELELILDYEPFCAAHLSGSQYGKLRDIARDGDLLQRFAAEWALEQLVPWSLFPNYREHCLVASYEELCTRLEPGLHHLADYCGLHGIERILDAAGAPSASTADERLAAVRQVDTEVMLSGWRRYIDEEAEQRIFAVIALLGIDYYEPGRDRPRAPYLVGF